RVCGYVGMWVCECVSTPFGRGAPGAAGAAETAWDENCTQLLGCKGRKGCNLDGLARKFGWYGVGKVRCCGHSQRAGRTSATMKGSRQRRAQMGGPCGAVISVAVICSSRQARRAHTPAIIDECIGSCGRFVFRGRAYRRPRPDVNVRSMNNAP